jgi:hypothetical protein
MILNPPFIKTNVHAGEPVTAQAWNDIVNAIGAISDFIETSAASSVKVQVAGPNLDVSTVRVTATQGGISNEAVRPVTPDTLHIFHGLPAGNYTIRAEAPGFDPATINLAIPAGGVTPTQNIPLTKHGSFMPFLFGKTLTAALAQLTSLSIAVSQVIDVTGTQVPPASPGTDFGAELVLMQYPPSGIAVGTASGESAQLLISAVRKTEPTVVMPSLLGLTLAEANKALEAAGLKVGNVTTLTSSPATQPTGPGGGPGPGGLPPSA